MQTRNFIDSHLHLFNLQDIPLYATLESVTSRVNTLSGLAAGLAAGFAGDKILQTQKEIILFFERRIEQNIELLSEQISKTSQVHALGLQQRIIIPLTMDFDWIRPSFGKKLKSQKSDLLHFADGSQIRYNTTSIQEQMNHLQQAIQNKSQYLEKKKTKVFPFLGYHLPKLKQEGLNGFIQTWEAVGGITEPARRSNPDNLKNGDVIGIKLYPPIGFKPYPNDETYRKLFLQFYAWCTENKIPITVHCQRGSYSTRHEKTVNYNTHPSHWHKVLKETVTYKGRKVALSKLRINFAHFGGEKDIVDTVDPMRKRKLEKGKWCTSIIKMLHDYPNTYADLSAFDFDNTAASRAFRNLISFDHQDVLGPRRFALASKLIWGSDMPMTISGTTLKKGQMLSGESHYNNLFTLFTEAVRKADGLDDTAHKEYIHNLTSQNPMHFLFPQ